jgi:hypothetical protein
MSGVNRRDGIAAGQEFVTTEILGELRALSFLRIKPDQVRRSPIEADEMRRRRGRRLYASVESFG